MLESFFAIQFVSDLRESGEKFIAATSGLSILQCKWAVMI